MKMKAAEAVVKILEKEGISHIFGIPGAGINGVYRFIGGSSLKHFCHRHEEACVHAAGGFFRASHKMAAAICTSGPGATNFITGLYTCQVDSIPVIAITGQAARSQLGKDAFQCVDIAQISKPVTKKSYCITDPNALPECFREGFRIAREGKPGPVLFDLPLDVQNSDIDFDINLYEPYPVPVCQPDAQAIAQAVEMIKASKRPVMLMGGGVILAQANEQCVRLAETLHIPVITTYMAKGGIPLDHPLNAGHCGIQVGQPFGNHVMLEADLVIAIGNRFTDRHTGDLSVYRGKRKFIHINIEPSEINKIFPADLGIVSDAELAIEAMQKAFNGVQTHFEWDLSERFDELRSSLARKTDYTSQPIKPHRVFQELNRYFGDNAIFTTGCGITQIWSGQLQNIGLPMHYLPSGGAGCLGYDIPAAFGAYLATGKQTVAVMGDFGFTFHVQELAVCAKNNVPVIVVIVNNAYLGLIRQNQKYAYHYECDVEMPENQSMIDYVMVAHGFGCYAERVFNPDDIGDALKRAQASGKTAVIDVICDPSIDCSMGNSLDSIREFTYEN